MSSDSSAIRMDVVSFSSPPLVDPNNLGLVEGAGQLRGVLVHDTGRDELRPVVTLPLDQEAWLSVDLPSADDGFGGEAPAEAVFDFFAAARADVVNVFVIVVVVNRVVHGIFGLLLLERWLGDRQGLRLRLGNRPRPPHVVGPITLSGHFLSFLLEQLCSPGPFSLGKVRHLFAKVLLEVQDHFPGIETRLRLPRVVPAVVALPLDEVTRFPFHFALVDDPLDHVVFIPLNGTGRSTMEQDINRLSTA